jgi:DNA phosphorothioation-dependent restriction protein DptG
MDSNPLAVNENDNANRKDTVDLNVSPTVSGTVLNPFINCRDRIGKVINHKRFQTMGLLR